MATSVIPSVYYIWFTIIDPILAVYATIVLLFNPASLLLSFTPSATIPPTPDTKISLVGTAGAYGCLFIIHRFVLRPRPDDLALWKSIQAGQALFEGAKLVAICWTVAAGGGFSTKVGVNIGITTGIVLFRVTFLLELGQTKAKVA